jgi:hypothetical protein
LINSTLGSDSARRDLLEKVSSDRTTELKQSLDAIVKRVESIHINPAKTELNGVDFDVDTASKKATEITHELRTIDWL